MPTPIDLKLVSCKEKLINLTRQNNLLFYKKRKSSSLVVKCDDFQNLYDALIDEKSFRFWEIPEEEPEQTSESDSADGQQELLLEDQSIEEDGIEKTLSDWLQECPPEDDELVGDFSTNKELHKILKNLYRRSKTEYEERGLNIAYIFFGLVEWSDNQNGERIKSPLVLVPIKIEHKSASESYKITLGDEEIVLNPALRVKFKKDFNVVLPELEGNAEDWRLEKYFSSVEKELAPLNVKVSFDVHIGLFSFHKLIMYADYEKHHELMKEHFLISCFGGDGDIDGINSQGGDRIENLDEIRDLKRQFHVLDVDSSQQRCIEAACNGASFVMVGPPGTGKSQTIANIVAEFIEDGKSVLFVSDKMAALEVVFKRLQDCGLADFCLELHSHKANKRQVITELGKSLSERVVPTETIAEMDYKQFLKVRDRLNGYLLAIHARREPLGMSVYGVLGCLAAVEELPYVPTGLPHGVEDLTQETLLEFDALFDSLESLWDVFIKGDEFSWHGFKSLNFTPTLRYRMDEVLTKILTNGHELTSRIQNFRDALGLSEFVSFKDARRLLAVLELLVQDFYVPSIWVEKFSHQDVSAVIAKSKESQQRYKAADAYLKERFADGVLSLSDEYLSGLKDALRGLQQRLGVQDYQVAELIWDLPAVKDALLLLEETLRRIYSNQEILWQDIEVPAAKSLKNAEIISKVVALTFDDEKRPELLWFDAAIKESLVSRLKELEGLVHEIQAFEHGLLEKYKPEVLNLETDRLLRLFQKNGYYRTYVLKYLSVGYHRDARKIIDCCLQKQRISPQSFYDDLLKIKQLADLRNILSEQEELDRRLFGRFYAGEKTIFSAVHQAIESLANIEKSYVKLGLSCNSLLIEKLQSADVRQRCLVIAEEIMNQDKKIFEFLLGKGIPIGDIKSQAIPDLLSSLSLSISSISALLAILPSIESCLKTGTKFPSLLEIEELQKRLRDWRGVKQELFQQGNDLSMLFGGHYDDVNTDWAMIEKTLQWYMRLLGILESLPPDGKFSGLLLGRKRNISESEVSDFKRLLESISGDCTALWSEFTSITFQGRILSWENDSFALTLDKVQVLKDSLEELKLWIEWQGLCYSLGKAGLDRFLSEIFKSRDQVFPEQVRSIFRKAVYSEWLNSIYSQEEALKDFRGEDHTKARDKFVELDIKLNRLSRALVIQSANERKPVMLNGGGGGSQVGILRREMAKQRRHKPIKKLFSEIFDLIIKLKRCFLMSPMSVCQYLEPGKFKFDLVIFDEASQICVEDALPPILRGTQVIVAGDNKQLPPTSFFKAEAQYEFDEDEDAPDIENLESILDECRGLGLKEHMLKWHYRSRHEDLITYSNCKFYDRQLVTFPSSEINVDHLGVKFDFVENAIYDRGGKRNNLGEAKRVAELVFEHFRNHPNKSLGVATLSVAQMEVVWDAIELKLKENSEYSQFFSDNRLEGFFVKNLENVQGDERDVMIFCVGYGKDKNGRLSMNFGPLNRSGGERRLNVLITRAREKNIVVASIRASDFAPNITAEGALHLRNYLAFAERGIEFLEPQGAVGSEDFESPLEESVGAAIRELGYELVCQVGCAGYRIDLGVVDPMNPQKYILGIECDGATYHSSHSARDRDRLRQSVLEGMGWQIYRIWSPDWVHKRNTEIARLKNAIENARFARASVYKKAEEVEVSVEIVRNSQESDWILSVGEEYSIPELMRHFKSDDFYASNSGKVLRRKLMKIIDCEAPIHVELLFRRVMLCFHLNRMGDKIEARLKEILRALAKEDKSICLKGGFVYTERTATARRPNLQDEETMRKIEHIAPEEIRDAMVQIVRAHSGVTMDCLFAETLRFFGFQRQTDAVVRPLKQNANKLISIGKIVLKDTFLIAVD